MTILSISQLLPQPRMRLWHIASTFDNTPQWMEGVTSVHHMRGNPRGVGGVWRVQLNAEEHTQIVEFEITEWLEGERFSVRPVQRSGVLHGIELFQLIFDLGEQSPTETRVGIQCEYEPRSKFGRIKNLAFLRRQYIAFLHDIIGSLNRLSNSEFARSDF